MQMVHYHLLVNIFYIYSLNGRVSWIKHLVICQKLPTILLLSREIFYRYELFFVLKYFSLVKAGFDCSAHLGDEEGRQFPALVRAEVPHLLHVDAEGEEELLLEVDDEDVVVVENLAEIVQLLEAGSDVVGAGPSVCYPHELVLPSLSLLLCFLVAALCAPPVSAEIKS